MQREGSFGGVDPLAHFYALGWGGGEGEESPGFVVRFAEVTARMSIYQCVGTFIPFSFIALRKEMTAAVLIDSPTFIHGQFPILQNRKLAQRIPRRGFEFRRSLLIDALREFNRVF